MKGQQQGQHPKCVAGTGSDRMLRISNMIPRSRTACAAMAACFCICQAVALPVQPGESDTFSPAAEKGGVGGCWLRENRVQAGELVQFRVAVKHSQAGLEQLEETLLGSSDPSSPQYGRHLSLQKVQELVAPHPQALQTIREWLHDAGANDLHESSNGDFISGLLAAEIVELLLGGVQLFRFQCTAAAARPTIIRAGEAPRLPTRVADVVDFVSPGYRFPAVKRIIERGQAPPPIDDGVTPSMLRKLYNISDVVGGKSDSSQGVASFLENYFSASDLLSFQKQYAPESQGRTPKVIGSNKPSSPTLEASLDLQYLMSVAPAVSTEFWYTSGSQPHNPGAEPFIEWLAAVAGTPDKSVPKVFSISYADDEDQVEVAYARRVSVELQKAAARGLTIVVATGDGGVGGNTGNTRTLTPALSHTDQRCHGRPFIPTFPSSSPYITAVGGTWNHHPEVGFQISSGGFSNYFERPKYQHKAVHAFLASAADKLPPKHRYNASGRAFPDVAAQSASFKVKVDGKDNEGYGTSCAAPVVAAVISLLNDERLAIGKSTLGFVNPLIYANLELFNDITAGNNPGCGSAGFWAQKGWDPVTGAGSPDFGKLLALVLSLP